MRRSLLPSILVAILASVILMPAMTASQVPYGVDVYFDPGHGGTDPGGLIPSIDTLDEKDVNLLVAKKLKFWMLNQGDSDS